MIFLITQNHNAISAYLQKAGLKCPAKQVFDFAQKCEADFEKNQIPEPLRETAVCSKVWTDTAGAYQFTIKRMTKGYWALLSAKGESYIGGSTWAKIDEQSRAADTCATTGQ